MFKKFQVHDNNWIDGKFSKLILIDSDFRKEKLIIGTPTQYHMYIFLIEEYSKRNLNVVSNLIKFMTNNGYKLDYNFSFFKSLKHYNHSIDFEKYLLEINKYLSLI